MSFVFGIGPKSPNKSMLTVKMYKGSPSMKAINKTHTYFMARFTHGFLL
jgi:hypothetical protein